MLVVSRKIVKVVERVFPVNMLYVFVITVIKELVSFIKTFVIETSASLILQCFIIVLQYFFNE